MEQNDKAICHKLNPLPIVSAKHLEQNKEEASEGGTEEKGDELHLLDFTCGDHRGTVAHPAIDVY